MLRWIRLAGLGFGIVCALTIGALWLAFAQLNDHRADIELAVSNMLGQRITIGAVEVSWEAFTPVLRLRDVVLFSPGHLGSGPPPPVMRLANAEVAVDALASARARALRSSRLRVIGAALTLSRAPSGQVELAGFGQDPGLADPSPGSAQPSWPALLAAQQDLELLATNVLWHEPGQAGPVRTLGQLNVRIRKQSDGHQARGWLTLENATTAPISIRADITGDLTAGGWAGTARLEAADVQLAALSRLSRGWRPQAVGAGVFEFSGQASLTLSIDLGPEGPRAVDGALTVRALQVYVRRSPPDGPAVERILSVKELAVDGRLVREATGWSGRSRELRVVSRSGVWPTAEVAVRTARPSQHVLSVDVEADAAPVAPLRGLIEPSLRQATVRRLLSEMSPRGILRHLTLRTVWDHRALVRAEMRTNVVDLASAATKSLPGVTGVNGTLSADLEGGIFELAPGPLAVDFPAWYESDRRLESASGTVQWALDDEGGRAWSERLALLAAGARAEADGTLSWKVGQPSPHLAGRLTLAPGRFDALAPWISITRIPPAVREWIAAAVTGGTLERMTVTANGVLGDLPFDSGYEGFELEARLAGAGLTYASRWPSAAGVSASVRIGGPRFEADVSDATIFDSRVEDLRVRVEDLRARPVSLLLTGKVRGDAADLLRFARQSPLRGLAGADLDQLAVSGGSRLDLALSLELPAVKLSTLQGTVALSDNRIEAGEKFTLEKAHGTVVFTPREVRVEGLSGRYLGAPVTLDTVTDRSGAVTLNLRGVADRAFVRAVAQATGLAGPSFEARAVSGKAPWSAEIPIAGPRRGQGPDPSSVPGTTPSLGSARVLIRSNLAGLDLDLPGSLGKRAAQSRGLRLEIGSSEPGRRIVKLDYGPLWRSVLALNAGASGWAVERGHLRVGGAEPELPAEPGLLVNGKVDTFHFDAWNRAFSGPDALTDRSVDLGVPAFRSLALELGSVRAFDQLLKVERIVVRRPPGGWELTVAGDDLDGRILVPHQPKAGTAPVLVQLNRLQVNRPANAGPYEGRPPAELPPVDVVISAVRLNGLSLGTVRFHTAPTPTGVDIHDITLSGAGFSLRGNAGWTFANQRHTTTAKMYITAPRLSGLLDAFGYTNAEVKDGDTEIDLDLSWEGVPSAFDLAVVNGTLQARSTKGQLLDVKPGITGRAFGLLSLAALPRHLSMDFSHVFGKGFSYDTIEGSFHLEAGNAYTNNLHMIGPSARVDLAGRTGLVTQDYDQLVTVTPRLTSSLPLAPLWLAEKMLKTDVFNRVFSSRYALTGSWDKPQVTALVPPEEVIPN